MWMDGHHENDNQFKQRNHDNAPPAPVLALIVFIALLALIAVFVAALKG